MAAYLHIHKPRIKSIHLECNPRTPAFPPKTGMFAANSSLPPQDCNNCSNLPFLSQHRAFSLPEEKQSVTCTGRNLQLQYKICASLYNNVTTSPSLCFLYSPSRFSNFKDNLLHLLAVSGFSPPCLLLLCRLLNVKGELNTEICSLVRSRLLLYKCSDINRVSFLKTLFRSQVVWVSPSSCPSDVFCPAWALTCCILIPGHDWEWCSLKGLPGQMVISQHPWGLHRTNISG